MQHHVADLETAAAHTLRQILDRGNSTGHDVDLDLEPNAAHAERIVNILLSIDDEFLRQDMEDLLVVGNCDRLRRFDNAVDVGLRYFLFFDRHHSARIQAADMAAGDARVHLAYPAIGHQLGFLDHPLNRRHRRLDVDDDAFLEAA